MELSETQKEILALVRQDSKPCPVACLDILTGFGLEAVDESLQELVAAGVVRLHDGCVHLAKPSTDAEEHLDLPELKEMPAQDIQPEIEEEDPLRALNATDSTDSLQLSARPANAIKRMGLSSVERLVAYMDEFAGAKGVGAQSVDEIARLLRSSALFAKGRFDEVVTASLCEVSGNNDFFFDPFGNLCKAPTPAKPASAAIDPANDAPIEQLPLREAIAHCFIRNGVKTVSQAMSMTDDALLRLRGVGLGKVEQLREAIKAAGFEDSVPPSLGMPEEQLETKPLAPDAEAALEKALKTLKGDGLPIYEPSWRAWATQVARSHAGAEEDLADALVRLTETDPAAAIPVTSELLSRLDEKAQKGDFDALAIPEGETWEAAAKALCDADARYQLEHGSIRIIYPSLDEWMSTLADKDRNIIARRLEGKTLEQCGDEFGITRERVRQICSSRLDRRPTLDEDRFRFLFEKYDLNEKQFVEATGADTRVYRYLDITAASKRSKRLPLEEAIEDEELALGIRSALDALVAKRFVEIGGKRVEKDKRSIISALVEEHASATPISAEHLLDLYSKTIRRGGLEDVKSLDPTSLRAFSAILERTSNVIDVPRPQELSQGKNVRYYDEDADFELLLARIENGPYQDMELSASVLVNDPRFEETLESFDIHDEYELHYIVKRYCPQSDAVTLGRTPFLTIGKASRHDQVLEVIKEIGPADANALAEEYEARYGVAQPTFKANFLKDFEAYARNGKYACTDAGLTQEQIEFLRDAISGSYTALSLVRTRFRDAFPEADALAVSDENLKTIGYGASETLIVKPGADLKRIFHDLIYAKPRFALDDPDIGMDVCAHADFASVLRSATYRYDFIEYEKDRFVSLDTLRQIEPTLSRELFQDYMEKARTYLPKGEPFNAQKLRRSGFEHALDGLREALGVGDCFFDAVISQGFVGGRLKRASMNETTVFCVVPSHFRATDLLESIVAKEGCFDMDDLVDLLADDFGIQTSAYYLRNVIARSDLYYHQGLEMVFESAETYERMARQWI